MKKFKFLLVGDIVLIMIACQTFAPKKHNLRTLRIQLYHPGRGWQTMEQFLGYPQEAGRDHYAPGVEEIIIEKFDNNVRQFFEMPSILLQQTQGWNRWG